MEGYPPLAAMLEVVAIAGKALEPRPVVPDVHRGTPVDDAAAAMAAQIERIAAEMAAQVQRGVAVIEAMIFDGIPDEAPYDEGEN